MPSPFLSDQIRLGLERIEQVEHLHCVIVEFVGEDDSALGIEVAARRLAVHLIVIADDGGCGQSPWIGRVLNLPVEHVVVPDDGSKIHLSGDEADPVVHVAERGPPCQGRDAQDGFNGFSCVPEFSEKLLRSQGCRIAV